SVEVARRSDGTTRRIDCDTVVFTGDWIPDHELARAGGLDLDLGTRGPRVDAAYRTSSPGVFAAGNLLHGAEAADRAALEGRACAAAIAGFLARPDAGWRAEPVLPVQVVPPLKWIVPGLLAGGAPRVFVARV